MPERMAVVAILAAGVMSMSAGCGGAAEEQEGSKSCWVDLDTAKSLCVNKPEELADTVLAVHGVLLGTDDGLISPSVSVQGGGMRPQQTIVIGIIYEHINYGGASLVFTSANGCSGVSYE